MVYKNWHVQALARDNCKCVVCGTEDGLVVHHRDNSRKTGKLNNDLKNLMTLCRQCHMREHGFGEGVANYDVIREYREGGYTYEAIAKCLGVSRQRVHQIYTRAKPQDIGKTKPEMYRKVRDNIDNVSMAWSEEDDKRRLQIYNEIMNSRRDE